MALLRGDVPFYVEIFAIEDFLKGPALLFGYQDTFGFRPSHMRPQKSDSLMRKMKRKGLSLVERWQAMRGMRHSDLEIPDSFKEPDLVQILRNLGIDEIKVLDYFDPRADYRHDMNAPVPAQLHDRFNTVIDIGSLEHVFDTKQCLDNLFLMLREGGHILLHTPCRGWFDHGLHTFSPECIFESLRLNGFELKHIRYSTPAGLPVDDPKQAPDVTLWVVGIKTKKVRPFVVPQQGRWNESYGAS